MTGRSLRGASRGGLGAQPSSDVHRPLPFQRFSSLYDVATWSEFTSSQDFAGKGVAGLFPSRTPRGMWRAADLFAGVSANFGTSAMLDQARPRPDVHHGSGNTPPVRITSAGSAHVSSSDHVSDTAHVTGTDHGHAVCRCAPRSRLAPPPKQHAARADGSRAAGSRAAGSRAAGSRRRKAKSDTGSALKCVCVRGCACACAVGCGALRARDARHVCRSPQSKCDACDALVELVKNDEACRVAPLSSYASAMPSPLSSYASAVHHLRYPPTPLLCHPLSSYASAMPSPLCPYASAMPNRRYPPTPPLCLIPAILVRPRYAFPAICLHCLSTPPLCLILAIHLYYLPTPRPCHARRDILAYALPRPCPRLT
eukprot:324876-Rhodomonas_salina.1